MKKVIIWGHKNNHTHSYIHSSYYKAFKSLGYDVYWFDDYQNVSGFDFENCIFFTEGQVQNNIPLNKSSKYIIHHTNIDKYVNNDLDFLNLANYLNYCDDGISAYHKENNVEKVNDTTFWDQKTRTLYQPWGTDLLPNEIDINHAKKGDVGVKDVYYVGLSHDNTNQINSFSRGVFDNGYNFQVMRTNTDYENFELIRKSALSVDLRGDWHLECGYIPCRVFKNISYGRLTGTNSKDVKKIFGDYVVYEENPYDLFLKLKEEEEKIDISIIKDVMEFIKQNHTFINRVQNILKFL